MPRQRDLISRDRLHVRPEVGRTEPRLWVRRLVLWSEPGVIIRDILLRPGLNIIWSPDPADQLGTRGTTAIGHGSGKTLFCRLLRYCLGEEHFALDDQRYRIANAFPRGLIGAEVRIDGTTWAVRRPVGMGRQHFAISNGSLDDITVDLADPTGVEPFLEAVEKKILSKDVVSLIHGERPLHAWLTALAWLARDQECRFDHVLDWRSSASDSGSPARSLSTEGRLDALRALIGALAPEEHNVRAEIGRLGAEHQDAEREASHRKWEAEQLCSQLVADLGLSRDDLPPGRLTVEQLRRAAKETLANLAPPGSGPDVADFSSLRTSSDEAERSVNDLVKDLTDVEARISEIERLVSLIRGEQPGVTFSMHEAENPVCPICEVPIDRSLAEGCKLSHKLPNPHEIRLRWEKRRDEFQEESRRLEELKERRAHITGQLAATRKQADELREQLRVAERTRDVRAEAWFRTRRLFDDVNRLDELLVAQEQTQSRADRLADRIEAKRQQTGAYRDAQAVVFNRLSKFFDAIIRGILGSSARGRISLNGSGLRLSVNMEGERSTAAIDSLKILAFDLAVLCMSIEGAAKIPAFLIHDSPREADLGQSLYHRLFRLAWTLEQSGKNPIFQYIITTTTRPPEEFLKEPWLRIILEGTPAEGRLLKRDL